MDQQLLGQLGQGGVSAALIFIIVKGGLLLIAAVKDVVAAIRELRDASIAHTKAIADLRTDLAELNAKVDVIADVTPIRGVPRAATAGGYYGPRKPPREDGE